MWDASHAIQNIGFSNLNRLLNVKLFISTWQFFPNGLGLHNKWNVPPASQLWKKRITTQWTHFTACRHWRARPSVNFAFLFQSPWAPSWILSCLKKSKSYSKWWLFIGAFQVPVSSRKFTYVVFMLWIILIWLSSLLT